MVVSVMRLFTFPSKAFRFEKGIELRRTRRDGPRRQNFQATTSDNGDNNNNSKSAKTSRLENHPKNRLEGKKMLDSMIHRDRQKGQIPSGPKFSRRSKWHWHPVEPQRLFSHARHQFVVIPQFKMKEKGQGKKYNWFRSLKKIELRWIPLHIQITRSDHHSRSWSSSHW